MLFVFLLLAGGVVAAHHGYTDFDRARVVTIEGTLEELVYGNPHIVMRVKTATGMYTASWESPNMVARRVRFDANTFKVGDRVVVKGSPAKDPSVKVLTLLKHVSRPKDGWVWSVPGFERAGT
jgi:hypothetical protein